MDKSDIRTELVKEVIARASKAEKVQYGELVNLQLSILRKLEKIQAEIEVLDERKRLNVFPSRKQIKFQTDETHKQLMEMSNGEFQNWSRQLCNELSEYNAETKRYNQELEIWEAKNNVITKDYQRLTRESVQLTCELVDLREKEKWLLISITLRSQPNLFMFMREKA